MKQTLLASCLVMLALFANAQVLVDENAIPGQFIVQLKGNVQHEKFFDAHRQVQVLRCVSASMNIWLVHSEAPDQLASLQSDTCVIVAQYDHSNILPRTGLIPNDSLFNLQWNLLNTATPGADISATEAWQLNHSNVSGSGDSIVIGVVDGAYGIGFNLSHPDINFYKNHHEIPNNGIDDDSNGYIDDYLGWNLFFNNDSVNDVNPGDFHPTHVSGIAGALSNNQKGIAGVCWGGQILALCAASNTESYVIGAYAYAVDMRRLYNQTHGAKGAFIVSTNSSFGVGSCCANPANYPIWCAMYDSLGQYGILSATAAPDESINVDTYGDVPTGCPSKWMISVTNTTSTDHLYPQAGYGRNSIAIGAPGTRITSTVPLNGYQAYTGTSMSAPHLAGAVAAMVANACPRLLQDYKNYPDSISLLLKNYIMGSADPLSDLAGNTESGGRLNLYHAFLMENGYNCSQCTFSDSISSVNLICNGDSSGSIRAFAGTGNNAYHFLWSTGDTTSFIGHLAAGWYSLSITDTSGCRRETSVLVHQPQAITLNSIQIVPITPGGAGNIIVSASAGADTLYYSMDGSAFQTGDIFTTAVPGAHSISIRDQSGCVLRTTAYIYFTGIEKLEEVSEFSFSPNPAGETAMLHISGTMTGEASIEIDDLSGRPIFVHNIELIAGLQQMPVNLASLQDGIYIVKLISSHRQLASSKFAVSH